ncbi:penicillin-binding transpeptidase domain-containing protein [Candidatus Riesia pediculischaeffi]|uniref:Cell division protein FtsI Peptidoglycan synthetase n=1 Tax=Candidatus Riesia pediculischaeffi PTSU TaxID=1401651 RepID=A0A0C1V8L8_9ENTR|nr:penicillin-binding transpeptidase domain-containing protein [Candidatus Riesia pediculischaeffi]KIE64183.1 Cell division protein FtsI Peptidoglycan synthetase [Candidatus Riesia pediculischaeffi PTSU]
MYGAERKGPYHNLISKDSHSYKEQKKLESRFLIVLSIFLICIIVILLRAGYLQIFDSEKLVKFHNVFSLRTKKIQHDRGLIFDRNGKKLAVNLVSYSIAVDPKIILKFSDIREQKNWKKLSIELKIPIERIYHKIMSSKNLRFVYLVRRAVGLDISSIVKMKISGLYIFKELRRYYPYGKFSSSLLGLTNIDHIGIEGIEKSFDLTLNGIEGQKIVRVGRSRETIEEISVVKQNTLPQNLTLSIDSEIQSVIYKTLEYHISKNQAKLGISVLLDVNTGEILSMVSVPSTNPNGYFYGRPTKSTRNRAISDLFEPGSTVKPMIVIKALDKNTVSQNSIISTKPYKIGKHLIKDVKTYDCSSISEILQRSSNVGSSKIALMMSSKELLDTYLKFGFGKFSVGLFGEKKGRFPSIEKKLSPIEKATFSFGYGFMITPLQLAQSYASIGSYGIFRTLSILKKNSELSLEKRIFPTEIVQKVVNMMKHISLKEIKRLKKTIRYEAAIKTGTIKKVDHGSYVNKYISCTAGIAPTYCPKYSLVVIIDEPSSGKYYGNLVTTPAFTEIMNKILEISAS